LNLRKWSKVLVARYEATKIQSSIIIFKVLDVKLG